MRDVPQAEPRVARRLGADEVLSQLANAPEIQFRVLIVAPHPDDETIGAGGVLGAMKDAYVCCISDGAPRDRSLWPGSYASREQYAALRRRELERALALARIGPARISCLGAIDQTCSQQITPLARSLAKELRRIEPDVVVVTPYEGGHPDHDATALVTRAALELQQLEPTGTSTSAARPSPRNSRPRAPAPALIEMASYHLGSAGLESGTFLGSDAGVERQLDLASRARKAQMFRCHASQQRVLAAFGAHTERFRVAPQYDFTNPPHASPLFYETLNWPLTSSEWCQLARSALGELGLQSPPQERTAT